MVSKKDLAIRNDFVKDWIRDPSGIPFTFTYGGEKKYGVPGEYSCSWEHLLADSSVRIHRLKAVSPDRMLELTVEYVEYADFPVCEWTVWIRNAGKENSKLIERLRGMEYSFQEADCVLWKCNGDFCSEKGYAPSRVKLTAEEVHEVPHGGRSCDGAFPYHRLQFYDYGVVVATGWPAQWDGMFRSADGRTSVDLGQQNTHFYLKPGETVRTPRMALLFHEGGEERAANLWRRWAVRHLTPREDGHTIRPRLIRMNSGGGEEFTCATEKNQLEGIAKLRELPLYQDSVWWIDAGWYPCYYPNGEKHWVRVGTWEPDEKRFPRGLGPVGERLMEEGIPFLLWFEPERVMQGQMLAADHPEWILKSADEQKMTDKELEGQTFLLNMADPECVDWLIDHVDRMIRDYKIKIYRQDFNMEPLGYWQANEAEDRRGMMENQHVQGYLRYWDTLMLRNPGLMIDACASGGRRYDLETMRRAVPMHPTDYGYGIHSVKLAFAQTMAEWFPYFRLMILSWEQNDGSYNEGWSPDGGNQYEHSSALSAFDVHCGLAPMVSPGEATKEQLEAIWKTGAGIMIDGDYYPLTPFSIENDHYVARQFYRPEKEEGFAQVIRLEHCQQESYRLKLKGLPAEINYQFRDVETGECFTANGRQMTEEGLDVAIPRRSGKMYWFQAV